MESAKCFGAMPEPGSDRGSLQAPVLSVNGLKGALQVCHVIVPELLDGCSRQGTAILDWVAHALRPRSKV